MINSECAIVLTTVDSESEAEKFANKILEAKLAACIQIQKIKSRYQWNGKIQRSDEYLLSIKTQADLFDELSEFIKKNHTYETPEILQISVTNVSNDYWQWIRKSCQIVSQ
ncbi:MAG: divalent-cation tolerance protein CutA [Holosporaceae bacterium]|nr:divalent-cation tolerance protein CutA [Holosporaceae bacterium]